MTRAPSNLLTVRRLLIQYLGPDARPRVGVTILDPLGDPEWEVGIVGDAGHRGGYHCGSDRLDRNRDYSVVESSRDRNGLTLDAAALDVGRFKVRTTKGTFDLPHYSRWLVAQCQAGTADTRHIREVIYSPDGKVVRRWDRLGRRSGGDNSHLGHTHESYFRDAIKAGADLTAVKRRYLTEIGLIEGDDMDTRERAWLHNASSIVAQTARGADSAPILDPNTGKPGDPLPLLPVRELRQIAATVAALRTDLAALTGRDLVDERQVAAELAPALLAVLTPEKIVDALPETLARQVADELAARLAAGSEQQG